MPSFASPNAPINFTHPLGTQVLDGAGGGCQVPDAPSPSPGTHQYPNPSSGQHLGGQVNGATVFFFVLLLPKSKDLQVTWGKYGDF